MFEGFTPFGFKPPTKCAFSAQKGPSPDCSVKGRLLTIDEGCGLSKVPVRRVISGAPARKYAWPWVALLGHKNNSRITFKCGKQKGDLVVHTISLKRNGIRLTEHLFRLNSISGGSLITSRHVLTAARCRDQAAYVET